MSATLLVLISFSSHAQLQCPWYNRNKPEQIIKTNLAAPFIGTYNLEYERAFRNRISFGISVNYMPTRNYLFKDYITENIDDELALRTINEGQMNHFSIVPQARFYFGDRETFTRFYFSPYLRYARNGTKLTVYYQELQPDNNIELIDIPLNGRINTYSIGYAFGLQFNLYKSFFLDWKIIGNHYGILNGSINGYSDKVIVQYIQDDINETMEILNENIPLFSFEHNTGSDFIEIKPKGINIGFVTGISIGYKF